MESMATEQVWPGPASPRVIHLKRQLKKQLRKFVRSGTTENRLATRARVAAANGDILNSLFAIAAPSISLWFSEVQLNLSG